MRILILSCNTGMGHDSAARALSEALHGRVEHCEVFNFMTLLPSLVSRSVTNGHVFLYRHFPTLFGLGYRCATRNTAGTPIKFSAHTVDKLQRVIEEGQYDTVLCAHLFPALAMTAIKRSSVSSVWCAFIATDYTCYPGVNRLDLDAYVIPHHALITDYVKAGLPRERILPLGIPVGAAFAKRISKKETRTRLGLPTDCTVALMSCGSMGCGPLRRLTRRLLGRMPRDCMLVVICGSNRALYRALAPLEQSGRLVVVGYTNQMSDYMDAADLYLTKTGGLSTAEAIAKHLPLIYIHTVPGCETGNLNFMIEHCMALTAKSIDELTALICLCLKQPLLRERLAVQMAIFSAGQDMARLADCLLEKAEEPRL